MKRGADRKPHVQRGAGNEAALWMKEHSTTLREAAEHFGATHQAVSVAWRRMFGDEPPPSRLIEDGKLGTISGLVDEGMTAQEIGRQVGLSPKTVAKYCRRHDLKLVSVLDQRATQRLAALERLNAGEPAADVAAEFNLSDGYLNHIRPKLKKHRGYVDRRDGRSLRAADLVRGGMGIREACLAERVSQATVRITLKRQAGRKS